MCDHEHGHALLGQLPHDGEDFAGQLRVQRRGRLVEVDDLRVGGKGAGDGDALLLAARKLAGVVVRPVGQTDLFQHLPADGVGLLLGRFAGNDEALGDVLEGGLVPEQVVVLEDEGRLFAQTGDVGFDDLAEVEGLAVKDEAAAVGGLQEVQAAQKGGLAGTAGAEDGHDVAFFHGQVHAAQHIQGAGHPAGAAAGEGAEVEAGLIVVGIERFVDVLNF